MKYLSAMFILVIWMALTVVLVISVIGILVLVDEDSRWMIFPEKILIVFNY